MEEKELGSADLKRFRQAVSKPKKLPLSCQRKNRK